MITLKNGENVIKYKNGGSKMEQKAQGAIEYLLIIGAAILVVAIVILAVTGVLGGGQDQTTQGQQDVNSAFGDLNALKGN